MADLLCGFSEYETKLELVQEIQMEGQTPHLDTSEDAFHPGLEI